MVYTYYEIIGPAEFRVRVASKGTLKARPWRLWRGGPAVVVPKVIWNWKIKVLFLAQVDKLMCW